jgi:hypothetical protein
MRRGNARKSAQRRSSIGNALGNDGSIGIFSATEEGCEENNLLQGNRIFSGSGEHRQQVVFVETTEPMVLVAYKPSNAIGILQTKLRYRKGHEARRGGLEPMPLDQHIEGGHGERQACLKIRPAPMHHLL